MSLWFLLAGIVIGIAVAAPIGPVNVICIQKAMRNGFLGAFLIGLGAAVGDTVFGAIAAFGLSSISDWLLTIERWLSIIGGIILIGMGFFAWRSRPRLTGEEQSSRDIAHGAAATFALTITNPITAIGFVALFTSIGISRASATADAASVVVGVFLGSALWWLFICKVAHSVRERMSDRHLLWINRSSAILIWVFAGLSLIKSATV